jgi:hypothetical protein
MSFKYPEIEKLNDLCVQHRVMIKVDRMDDLGPRNDYPLVDFTIDGLAFSLFVDDEYNDFKYNYPLLNLCLVLRELDGYHYAPEFEQWCQERYLEAKDKKVQAAFENLKIVTKKVESILGGIDPCVSDWDFEMNAGAAQELRKG